VSRGMHQTAFNNWSVDTPTAGHDDYWKEDERKGIKRKYRRTNADRKQHQQRIVSGQPKQTERAVAVKIAKPVTAADMARTVGIDPKAFRQALRDAKLPWHQHDEDWTAEPKSAEHLAMRTVLVSLLKRKR
jgi:hypothetical protein